MDQQIERVPDQEVDSEPGTPLVSKLRRCLMCCESFLSGWSGERICHKCRSRSVWRSGD
jgi:hypothetical protein